MDFNVMDSAKKKKILAGFKNTSQYANDHKARLQTHLRCQPINITLCVTLSIRFNPDEWADNQQSITYCDCRDILLLIIILNVTQGLSLCLFREKWGCDSKSILQLFSLTA